MDQVIDFIKPHLNKQHLEIEFRLGKKNQNGNYFDTNVGNETFDRVYRRLMKYPSWDSVKHENLTIFYGTRKGLRVLFDEEKDEQVACIAKHKVAHLDQVLASMPLDVRLSVSIENPAVYDPEKDVFTHERKRRRTSFVRKGLSIDMSIVENGEKDSENPYVYQIELEITDPPSELTDVRILNHYQKIFDVMKLLA